MVSAAITWQSWSRKWGNWVAWTRNVTATRPTPPQTRVAPENPQKQSDKQQAPTKVATL